MNLALFIIFCLATLSTIIGCIYALIIIHKMEKHCRYVRSTQFALDVRAREERAFAQDYARLARLREQIEELQSLKKR